MEPSYISMLLELFPNLAIALLALWYLAKQNQLAVESMQRQNDQLIALLRTLCQDCAGDKPTSQ